MIALLLGLLLAGGVEGRVVDGDGNPIPFARVDVPSKAVGAVGDRDGAFRLALDSPPAADHVVLFRSPGFVSREIRFADLPKDGVVRLETRQTRQTRLREQVTVSSRGKGKTTVVGMNLDPGGFQFGFAGGPVGSEVGTRLRLDRPSFIDSAHFVVNRIGGERFVYRVNLFEFDNGVVGNNLLPESVLVDTPQQVGTVSVDLAKYAIVAEGDLLLALEWVHDESGGSVPPLMFRGKRSGANPLHLRLTGQSRFEPVPLRKVSLGFYLVTYPLNRKAVRELERRH